MKYAFLINLIPISLGFFSCAAMHNLPRPEIPSDSSGVYHSMPDGTRIFAYTYIPGPRYEATIYVLSGVTGINHHKETDVIEALSGGENRVVIIHPRGTGYSDGTRGDMADYSLMLDDYVAIINADEVSGKRILFGHSMSAAITVAIADRVNHVAGIILVNPPFRLKSSEGMTPSFAEYVKYGFYYVFAPHAPIVNMAGDPALVKNPDEKRETEERQNDPLLVRYFSLYCMMESRKLMDSMVINAKRCTNPLLLIHGTDDSIVEESGCREIFDNWGAAAKEYLAVEHGPHGKLTVLMAQDTIRAWVAKL
jgi:alpha-beta hydrolase superfamily lysophospholipase